MRVSVEATGLIVERPSLAVVSDGSSSDMRLRSAAAFAIGTARDLGVRARHGFLSRPGLSPALSTLEDCKLEARGRFLTPLVENGLLDEGLHGTLICLVSGPVFDWDDWADALTGHFSFVHILRFARFDRLHQGAQEHDVAQLTDTAIETVLAGVTTQTEGAHVTIDSLQGVLLGMPMPLRAEPLPSGVRYEGVLPEAESRIALTAVSTRGADRVRVTVQTAEQAETGTMETEAPASTHSDPLAEHDVRTVAEALSACEKESDEYECPLCNRTHSFETAFVCEYQDDGIFCRRGMAVLEAWRSADSRRLALIPTTAGGWSALSLPETSAAWLGGGVLLRSAEGAHWILEPNVNSTAQSAADWRSRSLVTLWQGLERDPETGMLVVTDGCG